jgi:hypothetical protein
MNGMPSCRASQLESQPSFLASSRRRDEARWRERSAGRHLKTTSAEERRHDWTVMLCYPNLKMMTCHGKEASRECGLSIFRLTASILIGRASA